MILYSGLAPTHAQPLKKYGRRTGRTGADQREWLHWVEQIRAAAAPTRDDPAVLPPAILGQLPLFPVRRKLSIDVCRRILQRPLAGYREVVEHTAAFAADTGISKPMQRKLHEMLRLALAVRDADGDDLVDELVLDDIPNYGRSVRAILLRAKMLRLLPEPREPERPQQSRMSRTTRRVWAPPGDDTEVLSAVRLLVRSEDEGHLRALLILRSNETKQRRFHGSVRSLPPCRPAARRRVLPRMPMACIHPRTRGHRPVRNAAVARFAGSGAHKPASLGCGPADSAPACLRARDSPWAGEVVRAPERLEPGGRAGAA